MSAFEAAQATWRCQWDGTEATLAEIRSTTGSGEVSDGRLYWLGWVVEVGSWVLQGGGWSWTRTDADLLEEDSK